MFDDPKKSLQRLEEELWRAEELEDPEALEDLDALPEEELDYERSQWLRDVETLLQEDADPPVRNYANGYGRRNDAVDFHRTVYADEEMDENAAVFVEKRKKEKKHKKKGAGCLPLVALLELLAIAGLLWWWYRWLR